jgi:hypothetical protein
VGLITERDKPERRNQCSNSPEKKKKYVPPTLTNDILGKCTAFNTHPRNLERKAAGGMKRDIMDQKSTPLLEESALQTLRPRLDERANNDLARPHLADQPNTDHQRDKFFSNQQTRDP